MKVFLLLVLSVTAVFLWQRHGSSDAAPDNKPPAKQVAAAPAAPRPVSEHNWAKHSLDRANEVVDQVRKSRRENDQP